MLVTLLTFQKLISLFNETDPLKMRDIVVELVRFGAPTVLIVKLEVP